MMTPRRLWSAGAVSAMVLAAFLVVPGLAAAAAIGDWVDPTYGADGAAILPGPSGGAQYTAARQYTVDPTDRLYAATSQSSGTPPTSVSQLRRLTTAGLVDLTFAGGTTW